VQHAVWQKRSLAKPLELFQLRKVNSNDQVCIALQLGRAHSLPALHRPFTSALLLYFYQNGRKYEISALWTAFSSYVSHHCRI